MTAKRRLLLLTYLVGLGIITMVIAYVIYGDAIIDAKTPAGMKWIAGGEFDMGSDEPMFRDAQPVHRVSVDGFWIDETEVTNARFAEFVKTTGYLTVAERVPNVKDYPAPSPRCCLPDR